MSSEDTHTDMLKKKTMPLLRAVLTAKAKVGVALHMLCSEFEETCMEPLKFREMGYGSLEQFLRDCSDICTVTRAKEGYLVVKGIASKEDAHIYKLVSGQKKTKKKSRRVNIPVKRKAAHYTGGRRPNAKQPTIKYYVPAPQRSLLPNPTTKKSFLNAVPYSYNHYTKLRQTPTTSSFKFSEDLAPRFQRLRQNNQSPFLSKVQGQVNDQARQGQVTIFNNNCQLLKKALVTEPVTNTTSVRTNISPQELASLEEKLKKLLITKTNGLWATRLRPEFEKMYGEKLPNDVRVIIQENFLSFIKIDCPMPNMEILYLREEAKQAIMNPPPQRIVELKENTKNMSSQYSVKVSNGVTLHHSPVVNGSTLADDVICTSPLIDVPTLNISELQTLKSNKQKSLSPRISEFKIELPDLQNVGDEIKVFVCHVESVNRFFVQFADSEIQDLVDEMQLYYQESAFTKDIGKPRLNEYCCARYSKDKLWFRSKILSVKEQKNILNESYRCRVIYVDYGNDEYVISTELKCLTEGFCRLPAQAVQCCLYNLYPIEGTTWSEKVIEHFKHVTDGVELTMAVKEKNGPVLSIDLIDGDGQSVCAYFCSAKLGKRTNSVIPHVDNFHSPDSSPRSTSPRTPSPMEKVGNDSDTVHLPPSIREIKPRFVTAPTDQDYIDVSVSHINSTNDIAIVMMGPDYDEQLDRLEEKMSKYFERDIVLPSASLQIDHFYAVSYEDYWVRAKVLAINDSEVEVLLLDHGNMTIVSKDEIKDLPMQFLDPPFQAIPCSLANVPESFETEILQYLTENTLRKAMIGYIVERSSGPGTKISIELYDTTNESDDININNEIKEKIENEKNLCPSLPDIGEGHCNAYIAHISHSGEVFIQILGPGTERLEILMEDMTSHFTQTRATEIVQRPEVGNICCAKFFDDGSWYRAKVTKVMQKERKVEVEFIDYGNREVIQMLFIRNPDAVNKKVVSLPAQAVKCQLSGHSEMNFNEDTYKKMREFTQSLDGVYVSVVGYNGTIPMIKILVPSDNEEGDPVDFLERYEFEQLEEVKRNSESSDSSVFNNTTYKNITSFNTITNIDNTSFEDISVVGEESYCKISSVRTNDSNTILSEYDVITNVPSGKEGDKKCRDKNRSESPAFFFSPAWGIPQMMLTESVIEGVIQDSHDPSKFSFIPYRLWEALESLHVDMMEAYKDSSSENVTYNIGDVYAVYHHKHEIWYRAVIVAEIEDEVVVKYPDFSGTAEVEFSKNVRRLLPKFKTLPFLAVRSSLAGIEPIGGTKNWDSSTAGLFNEMVMNETFQVEIITSSTSDFSKPLEVLLHGANADGKRFIINDKLVKMGFARRAR